MLILLTGKTHNGTRMDHLIHSITNKDAVAPMARMQERSISRVNRVTAEEDKRHRSIVHTPNSLLSTQIRFTVELHRTSAKDLNSPDNYINPTLVDP